MVHPEGEYQVNKTVTLQPENLCDAEAIRKLTKFGKNF